MSVFCCQCFDGMRCLRIEEMLPRATCEYCGNEGVGYRGTPLPQIFWPGDDGALEPDPLDFTRYIKYLMPMVDQLLPLLAEFVTADLIAAYDSSICWGCGEIKQLSQMSPGQVAEVKERGLQCGFHPTDCLLARATVLLLDCGVKLPDWCERPKFLPTEDENVGLSRNPFLSLPSNRQKRTA